MGMHMSDVLYGFRPTENVGCVPLEVTTDLFSGKSDYLETDEWKEKQKGDFMLYDAVRKKLDATIENLGRDKFQKNLEVFKGLVKIGTKLSNIKAKEMKRKSGCGVLFPSPYSDIDELEYFDMLNLRDQNFVTR